jgi:recombination protein RecA
MALSVEARLKIFKDKVNKEYKGEILRHGDGSDTNLVTKRFSSQIFSYDLALGGGLPFGRILIDAGEESTGKTVKAIRACVSVADYDHNTRKHKDFMDEKLFVPGRALIIDVEGAWDYDWAERLGFDHSWHMIAQPEYAEQSIDITNAAIRENIFDIIVIDSIAAMIPSKELEDSAEDWQMGLQARLLNKAMRKWVGSLNKLNQTYKGGGPLLYCLNQFRYKIGMVFGDPRTLPGGQAQKFAASIISYTKSATTDDGKEKELEFVTLKGVCKKNKTFTPKINYEFNMRLKPIEGESVGAIQNNELLLATGKKTKLVKTEGRKLTFGKVTAANDAEFVAKLKVSPILKAQLWRSTIKAKCGVVV